MPSLVNGLGSTSFIPTSVSGIIQRAWSAPLTISEIHVYVLRSDIGGHGNDRNGRVDLSDARGGGYSVKVRHDDIHENQVEGVWPVVYLVNSL
jgi:hypothetical protein